jgi:RNA polymerase sigma-54 factor
LFARTLAECLGAQLAERDRLDPAMKALLDNLDLVAAGELGQLRRRCGVDDEDLRDMLAELRTLDPRPGQAFDFAPIQPVAPDLFLRPARDPESGEEGWHIELNTDALPKVLVDRNYHATLMKGARAKTDRDFVAERFQSANWLVKTLEQRATTILKVAREIVRQQDGFFRQGVSALKPLVLRDIAIATELHESTVSRVTSNKYIATPRGIFELKYFFTSALPARTPGVVVSSESVRSRIRHLVNGENAHQPLSDDRIVDLLKSEGVEIARRTVAKYREAMRIPSSAERRRLGRLGMHRTMPTSLPANHSANHSTSHAVHAIGGPAD